MLLLTLSLWLSYSVAISFQRTLPRQSPDLIGSTLEDAFSADFANATSPLLPPQVEGGLPMIGADPARPADPMTIRMPPYRLTCSAYGQDSDVTVPYQEFVRTLDSYLVRVQDAIKQFGPQARVPGDFDLFHRDNSGYRVSIQVNGYEGKPLTLRSVRQALHLTYFFAEQWTGEKSLPSFHFKFGTDTGGLCIGFILVSKLPQNTAPLAPSATTIATI